MSHSPISSNQVIFSWLDECRTCSSINTYTQNSGKFNILLWHCLLLTRIKILNVSLMPNFFPVLPAGYRTQYFFKDFFTWTICKVFIESVTILLPFYVLGFWGGHKACGVLAPWPGLECTSPVLEGQVLSTGQSGKSHHCLPSPFCYLSSHSSC